MNGEKRRKGEGEKGRKGVGFRVSSF